MNREMPGAWAEKAARDTDERSKRIQNIEAHAGIGIGDFSDLEVSPKRADTETAMNDITRPELDAKLEAIEARMDARVASTNTKIDAFLAAQSERDKATAALAAERDQRLHERVASSVTLSDEWNQKFRMLTEQATEAAKSSDASAKQAANLKTHFWASVGVQILAVAAIIVAAYFANQQIGIGFAQIVQSIYESAQSLPSAP
nr:hypothetical protein [uncultured Pseudomonas sp.]